MDILLVISVICELLVPFFLSLMIINLHKRIDLLKESFCNLFELVKLIDLQVDNHEKLLHQED